MSTSPHSVLFLHPDAPRELVEEAYWLLVEEQKRHPDDAPARARMLELNTSYERIVGGGIPPQRTAPGKEIASAAEPGLEDYYSLLRVERAAPTPVIELAYSILRRHLGLSGTGFRQRQLAQARETLVDVPQRRTYDYWLRTHPGEPFPEQLQPGPDDLIEPDDELAEDPEAVEEEPETAFASETDVVDEEDAPPRGGESLPVDGLQVVEQQARELLARVNDILKSLQTPYAPGDEDADGAGARGTARSARKLRTPGDKRVSSEPPKTAAKPKAKQTPPPTAETRKNGPTAKRAPATPSSDSTPEPPASRKSATRPASKERASKRAASTNGDAPAHPNGGKPARKPSAEPDDSDALQREADGARPAASKPAPAPVSSDAPPAPPAERPAARANNEPNGHAPAALPSKPAALPRPAAPAPPSREDAPAASIESIVRPPRPDPEIHDRESARLVALGGVFTDADTDRASRETLMTGAVSSTAEATVRIDSPVSGGATAAEGRASVAFAATPMPRTIWLQDWRPADSAMVQAVAAHWCVAVALLACFAFHAYHMTMSPGYDIDEGSILGQGWAVVRLGQLDPYTYWYDHPPFGWIVIGPLMWTLRWLGIGSSAVDAGRVVMLLLNLINTVMLFHITLRITGSKLAAMIAAVLLAASPLAIELHRLVKLDNIATTWMLASVLLLLDSSPRLNHVWLSALCLGAATLSKEPMGAFAPAALYIIVDRVDSERRPLALIGWITVFACAASVYPLFAQLRGELFPSGTLLGGDSEHVSLLGTLFGRSGDLHGSNTFADQLVDWWQRDATLVFLGGAAVVVNVVAAFRDRAARTAVALALPYTGFLMFGGSVRDYWVIPLLPILALNVALLLKQLFVAAQWGTAHLRGRGTRAAERFGPLWPAPLLIIAGLVVGAAPIVAASHASEYNDEYSYLLQGDYNQPHHDAREWIKTNIDPESFVVIDSTFLIDLREAEGGGFDRTYHYWIVDRDPEVREQLLHNDWRGVDYLVTTPTLAGDVDRGDIPFIESIRRHANQIADFGDATSWVHVYAVNKLGALDRSGLPRPDGVPATAEQVLDTLSVGTPPAAQGAAVDGPFFYASSCADDVLAVATAGGIMYAEIPCDQLWRFGELEGEQVAMLVSMGDPLVLSIQSAGKKTDLAVGRVWFEPAGGDAQASAGASDGTIRR